MFIGVRLRLSDLRAELATGRASMALREPSLDRNSPNFSTVAASGDPVEITDDVESTDTLVVRLPPRPVGATQPVTNSNIASTNPNPPLPQRRRA